jgi:Phosphotransferase enzyme family
VTDAGAFAVKRFDTTIDHAKDPRLIEAAFEVERRAFAAGLPLPRPVLPVGRDGCLDTVESPAGPALVRVHHWAEGRPVADRAAPPALAERVGALLAGLHAVAVPVTAERWSLGPLAGSAHWRGLAERAAARRLPWAEALPAVAVVAERAAALGASGAALGWPMLMTHRDLNQKNALRDAGGGPVVLDWDVAGPWTAIEETVAAALEWAGANVGEPEPAAIRALIAGYRAAGGRLDRPPPEALAGRLFKHLGWLELHVRRALDDHPDAAAAQRVAARRVPGLLATVLRIGAGAERWTDAIR